MEIEELEEAEGDHTDPVVDSEIAATGNICVIKQARRLEIYLCLICLLSILLECGCYIFVSLIL